MDYQKLEREFNELTEQKQWEFVIKYKREITLNLDNDATDFFFNEDKSDESTLFLLKADIGDRWGLNYLLPIFGINSEHV